MQQQQSTPALLRVEEVDELAGQDRDVGDGHVNQHGRRRR